MALTPKQQRFVAEYTVDFNATAAAVRAGYSKKTAAQQGYKLLQMPEIQEVMTEEFQKRQERTQLDGDYVVEKLKEIAEMTAADYTDSPLKFSNKIRVLELLGKHLGVFEPKSGSGHQDREDDPLTASLKEWIKQHGN